MSEAHNWKPVGQTGRVHRCVECDRWRTETPLPSGQRWVRLTGGGAPPEDFFAESDEAFFETSRFIEASLEAEVET